MEEIVVAIIEDDVGKNLRVQAEIGKYNDSRDPTDGDQFSLYVIKPVEIPLEHNIEDVLTTIETLNVDCLLVDYLLSESGPIGYTGVELISKFQSRYHDFPAFLLTGYEEDVYSKEFFDSYLIFDYQRYINEEKEQEELNKKIVAQVVKYRRQLLDWETRLQSLLKEAGTSASIDSQILELDEKLEKTLNGESRLPALVKKEIANKNDLANLLIEVESILHEFKEKYETP